ncbi:MAG: hypothetical protein KTR28_06920 [Micavibrio sp.]|nr:hypothetical protein [Micavibrio sp.]
MKCALAALMLGLAACSGGDWQAAETGVSSENPEDILNVENAEWTLVEEDRSPSPLEQHMDSRGKVHPTNIKESGSYTERADSMGVNEDINFRVLRLERQMDAVRQDLAAIKPKLGLMPPKTVKHDMAHGSIEPMKKAKMQHEAAVKDVVKPAPSNSGPLRVTGVRTGVHPGKYRFVMDVSGTPKFSYELDNAEHLLVVELPGTEWDAAAKKSLGGNPIVSGYSAEKADDKVLLVITLKGDAKVTMAKSYKPNSTYGNRIVLDIAPA